MPELAVEPAVLADVGHPLAAAGDRLAALSRALPTAVGPLGPDVLVHALEDAAHDWQYGLHALGVTLGTAGQQLVSAASAYDAVDALVSDWSTR